MTIQTRQARSTRSEAVDLFRGLGIWVIYIDHINPNFLSRYTPWHFGFSDFAEVFVFLSGFIGVASYDRAVAAFGGGWDVLRKLAHRVGRLYLAHLASFGLSVLLLALFARKGLRVNDPSMYFWMAAPAKYFAGTLALVYTPHLFSLLPLYVFLAPLLPLAAVGLRRWPRWTLGLSFALWLGCQFTRLNVPIMDREWHFNPFAWQFLLVLGGTAYRYRSRLRSIPHLRWIVAMAAAIVVASVLLKTVPGLSQGLRSIQAVGSGKQELAIYRLVHFAALLAIFGPLVSGHHRWLDSRIARLAILCGRDSLFLYASSLVLDIGASLILAATHGRWPLQLVLSSAGLVLLCALGWVRLEHFRK